MGITELILTALGLSTDAFAASVCRGLNAKNLTVKDILITALMFGGFQAAMPVIGYLTGIAFEKYITAVDHWIAFALLCFIGGKTLFDVIYYRDPDCIGAYNGGSGIKELLMTAVATSIDALAAGISLAFLNVRILTAAAVIGGITFVLSAFGMTAGRHLGGKHRTAASAAGGIILIIMGIRILMQHLNNS